MDSIKASGLKIALLGPADADYEYQNALSENYQKINFHDFQNRKSASLLEDE